jgi:CHAT domain-containing protein
VAWELKPLEPLPASAEEVRAIAALYRSSRKAPADVWEGRQASESRLKALAQAPTVLHLSTHGFYLAASADPGAEIDWHQEQPLLLSGLALAGANAGLQGQVGPDGEDGILYSLEILGLPLQGTELVALSACKTGQGVLDYSEGMYGLVRAFRIAGAYAVLMTLWEVGDRASKEFMVAFYKHWLQQKRSDPAAALRQTKLDYIHAKRDPQLWAPYVLISGR